MSPSKVSRPLGLPEPAATMARERKALLEKTGWKRLEQWDRNGPGVRRGPYNTWSLGPPVGCVYDHGYRLRCTAEDGTTRTVYVSEPYELGNTALAALAALAADGWDVMIRADVATHFPGATVAVWIEHQPKEKP